MTDSMLPIIRQMHDAESDAGRARLLLNVPDLILVKYADAFMSACRRARFDEGEEFILIRINAMRSVRDDLGNLPQKIALEVLAVRKAMVALVGALAE